MEGDEVPEGYVMQCVSGAVPPELEGTLFRCGQAAGCRAGARSEGAESKLSLGLVQEWAGQVQHWRRQQWHRCRRRRAGPAARRGPPLRRRRPRHEPRLPRRESLLSLALCSDCRVSRSDGRVYGLGVMR